MRAPFLALAALALLATTTASSPDAAGVVPLGTGAATVADVDHRRHAAPDGAVGLASLLACIPEKPCDARFALLSDCPDGSACAAVLRPPCVAAYALAGAVGTRYAFAWAFDETEASHLFQDLPRFARTPSAGLVHPTLVPDPLCA